MAPDPCMMHVKLMVLPVLTYSSAAPTIDATAAAQKNKTFGVELIILTGRKSWGWIIVGFFIPLDTNVRIVRDMMENSSSTVMFSLRSLQEEKKTFTSILVKKEKCLLSSLFFIPRWIGSKTAESLVMLWMHQQVQRTRTYILSSQHAGKGSIQTALCSDDLSSHILFKD